LNAIIKVIINVIIKAIINERGVYEIKPKPNVIIKVTALPKRAYKLKVGSQKNRSQMLAFSLKKQDKQKELI